MRLARKRLKLLHKSVNLAHDASRTEITIMK